MSVIEFSEQASAAPDVWLKLWKTTPCKENSWVTGYLSNSLMREKWHIAPLAKAQGPGYGEGDLVMCIRWSDE